MTQITPKSNILSNDSDKYELLKYQVNDTLCIGI